MPETALSTVAFDDAPLLAEIARGLDFRRACAVAGVPLAAAQARQKSDPAFAERVQAERDRAIARLLRALYERADKGDERAVRFFLETSGDRTFTPSLQVGRMLTDEDIQASPRFQRFVNDVIAVACEDCREKLKAAGSE